MKNTKTIYEQLGGTYREENGYRIPNLSFPAQTNHPIGKYGRMRLDYLKKHRSGRYTTLLTEGRLNAYLCEIDEQVQEMMTTLTEQMAQSQGIDEHMKATDQLRWVQAMSNIRNAAEEIVLWELILS